MKNLKSLEFETIDLSELKGGGSDFNTQATGCIIAYGKCFGQDSGCGIFHGTCKAIEPGEVEK